MAGIVGNASWHKLKFRSDPRLVGWVKDRSKVSEKILYSHNMMRITRHPDAYETM